MWQEPKTDRVSEDKFNKDSYNRIIGNVSILREMAISVYPEFSITDMGSEKVYGDPIYADEVNAIEENLTKICTHTYPFEIGEQRTYYPNQPATDWKEYNRIESACLLIYKNLLGQKSGKRRLAFTLGGRRF